MFHTAWYLEQNPDVAASGLNPLAHYLASDPADGRDPNPLFDTSWYLTSNPDLPKGANPLIHYLSAGAAEGRDPSPLFDTSWYLEQNADVAAAKVNPLSHFLSSGAVEARNPNPFFDTRWYLEQNPAVAGSGENPAIHYLACGGRRGTDPGPTFSAAYYRKVNGLEGADIGAPLAHYLASDLSARLRIAPAPTVPKGWDTPKGEAWRASIRARMAERKAALAHADLSPPFVGAGPTFSITTTVYDTDPDFVLDLAESVAAQAFTDFEWLVLDNGSTAPATVAACATLAAADNRVRLFHVAENRHIIGGNRYLLERATGRYVVPVDSDDLLYPDTLALLADVLRRDAADPPVLLYSDEQKIDVEGDPVELVWRRPFSRAAAFFTIPAAHLAIFARANAMEAGVYSDDGARGCHDWDTALRLTGNGARAVHVPEVLYGWRIHGGSTAFDGATKAYIADSHIDVLHGALTRTGLQDRFQIRPQMADQLGWYETVRTDRNLPACCDRLRGPVRFRRSRRHRAQPAPPGRDHGGPSRPLSGVPGGRRCRTARSPPRRRRRVARSPDQGGALRRPCRRRGRHLREGRPERGRQPRACRCRDAGRGAARARSPRRHHRRHARHARWHGPERRPDGRARRVRRRPVPWLARSVGPVVPGRGTAMGQCLPGTGVVHPGRRAARGLPPAGPRPPGTP